MDIPTYTMQYPRKVYYAGDTVDGFTFILNDNIGDPIVPQKVNCQVRDAKGKVVYTYTPIVSLAGLVSFESFTAPKIEGIYHFDVEYILSSGDKRTYIVGTLPIKKEVTK